MILGLDRQAAARHFVELDDALAALGRPDVILNAHMFPGEVPRGATILNTENIPTQLSLEHDWKDCEIWDVSARNCELWRAAGYDAKHVPLGYHPSFKRFEMLPWAERDIDVAFCGVINDRRLKILDELDRRGLRVHAFGPGYEPLYGAERDAVLARSKVMLNMLHADDAFYPTMRALHAVSNGMVVASEKGREYPEWISGALAYRALVDECVFICKAAAYATNALEKLQASPLVLPERKVPKVMAPEKWRMLMERPSVEWDLEKMYADARGAPVSEKPLVAFVVPSYRETERIAQVCRISRNECRKDLVEHGIQSVVWPLVGDSLICRMRQRACHGFLASNATHLLFCDADIECLTPDCVRMMLESGHDIVAGACPFKAAGGKTVHNRWPQDDGAPEVDEHGCTEVQDAGTGWMMISRRALIRMQLAHPELLHWSMSESDRGVPLWALFDTGVVNGVYQSEDFMLCHLWQELGGKVYVYTDAEFAHWGEMGYRGSFREQYGLDAEPMLRCAE